MIIDLKIEFYSRRNRNECIKKYAKEHPLKCKFKNKYKINKFCIGSSVWLK